MSYESIKNVGEKITESPPRRCSPVRYGLSGEHMDVSAQDVGMASGREDGGREGDAGRRRRSPPCPVVSSSQDPPGTELVGREKPHARGTRNIVYSLRRVRKAFKRR